MHSAQEQTFEQSPPQLYNRLLIVLFLKHSDIDTLYVAKEVIRLIDYYLPATADEISAVTNEIRLLTSELEKKRYHHILIQDRIAKKKRYLRYSGNCNPLIVQNEIVSDRVILQNNGFEIEEYQNKLRPLKEWCKVQTIPQLSSLSSDASSSAASLLLLSLMNEEKVNQNDDPNDVCFEENTEND